ncbi:MAG TPA: sigma-70 family RNA polymerase sigma factor [Pyrinomonadaceae bacterium]|jgi:RNA polymerase sigma factor (sigma-70 family)
MRSQKARNDPDTDIGGRARNFPDTSRSAIIAARSADPQLRQRAFAAILDSYWKPVYKYIRIKWRTDNEDAKDLTQGFFSSAFEKNYVGDYNPAKASFQTFLRTCVDRYVANQRKAERRLKRGGGLDHLSLDFDHAESELVQHPPAPDLSPEQYFEREWTRNLFTQAVDSMRVHCASSGNSIRFLLFEKYDLEGSSNTVSYSSLAAEFGLTSVTVTNQLAAARREFRKILLSKLRETTVSDDEFRNQARQLLGIEVK